MAEMTVTQHDAWGYLVIWEFRPRPGREADFVKAYGSDGDWVKLFRQDTAYLGTELAHDLEDAGRFLTLDFWSSRDAYEAFQRKHKVRYAEIDASCENLTSQERLIGAFEMPALGTGN
jgi:heme-degrading monooxygenase HmoA